MDKDIFPVPSKKALKKLGFLADQKGIVNRYLVEAGWKKHIERTQNFIVNSLKDCDFKTVSILGSGWFLDIPIEFLLEHFEKIYCFDVNHPRQITHKYRKESKIEFIDADITGGLIDKFYQLKQITKSDIPLVQPSNIEGVVVSLNLLSQLDNLLFGYSNFTDGDEVKIRKQIQQNHLKFLSHIPHLLISDYEEVYLNDEGKKIDNKPTIFATLPKNKNFEKWTWQFDTQKTYKNNCKTELKVIALDNLKI